MLVFSDFIQELLGKHAKFWGPMGPFDPILET